MVVLGTLTLLLALGLGAFLWWALTPLGPAPEALEAMRDDELVSVERTADAIVFTPAEEARVGFILYPGGRVDPESYAPLARGIAENGYLVAIVPVRFNLAILEPSAADDVIEAHPGILVWGVGGHSLGGVMAARYASEHRDTISALALLAAYPEASVDLGDDDMSVVTLVGDRDGVVDARRIEDGRSRLPGNASEIVLEGGNHAQFGSYGSQPGDNDAALPALDQLDATVEAVVTLLRPFRLMTL